MSGFRSKAAVILLSVSVFVLSACAPAATPSPTPDVNAIKTEVAQTVAAGLTQTATYAPTATSTNTPEPTKTPQPTATNTLAVTVSPAVMATSTSAYNVADKAQWMYNTPDDTLTTPVIAPGTNFTVTWHIKNIGTTTWTTEYQMRYYLGDTIQRMGASDMKFPKEVKPNEEVDLTLNFKAPTTPGEYNSLWVLTNKDGANFLNVNFHFKVEGTAPVATTAATKAPTTAPTVAPTVATTEATSGAPGSSR